MGCAPTLSKFRHKIEAENCIDRNAIVHRKDMAFKIAKEKPEAIIR